MNFDIAKAFDELGFRPLDDTGYLWREYDRYSVKLSVADNGERILTMMQTPNFNKKHVCTCLQPTTSEHWEVFVQLFGLGE